ncbi:putative HAUS augmin-like complex subunit 4-like protein [Naja naja]|nr:putative HAUS augmin-like complex subunit 4-like protein [Naja naja]
MAIWNKRCKFSPATQDAMAVVFSDSWIISFLLKFNSSFFAQSFCSPLKLKWEAHPDTHSISNYGKIYWDQRFIEAQYQNGLILIPISNMDSNIKYGFQYQVLIPNIDSKCLDVLSYFRPESDNVGATAQVMMLGALAESLATKNQHLKEARAYQEKLIRYLEQQKVAYLQVLLHCLGLLKQLAREFRLVSSPNWTSSTPSIWRLNAMRCC